MEDTVPPQYLRPRRISADAFLPSQCCNGTDILNWHFCIRGDIIMFQVLVRTTNSDSDSWDQYKRSIIPSRSFVFRSARCY